MAVVHFDDVEQALLRQTRRAIRTVLARPSARAPGLAHIRELEAAGAVGPLRARYYEPADAVDAPLVVYFHGGGFVCCDIDTHDSICSWLAKSSAMRVLSVGYRLAPETRFPAQFDDARAACAWALEAGANFGARPGQVILSGDSAGAYLAMSTAIHFNTAKPGSVPLQTLLYPLVHIQDSLWAEEELRNFRFVGRLAVIYIAKSLGAENFPSLCDLDLAHAPSTVLAGGGPLDPVRADVKTLSGALRSAGVRVVEHKYPVLMHGGLNFTAFSKTATDVLSQTGASMRAEWERLAQQ